MHVLPFKLILIFPLPCYLNYLPNLLLNYLHNKDNCELVNQNTHCCADTTFTAWRICDASVLLAKIITFDIRNAPWGHEKYRWVPNKITGPIFKDDSRVSTHNMGCVQEGGEISDDVAIGWQTRQWLRREGKSQIYLIFFKLLFFKH